MTTLETDPAVTYETEVRAKYNAKDLKALAAKGHAITNDDGSISYPIDDVEDLGKAIKAVGRGKADHEKIRAHIIARAQALNSVSMIPDNWNKDGSLKQTNSADDLEQRASNDGADATCDLCDGSGKIRAGKVTCPQCGGTGTAQSDSGRSASLDHRRSKAERLSAAARAGHLERRDFPSTRMELREDAGSGTLKLTGYASVTDTPYEVGSFRETIQRGAFKRTLGNQPDVQLLINHGDGGSGLPLAGTKSTPPTLFLDEDDRGLKVEADLDPDDPDVQLLASKMRRGLVGQMSFAFRATGDEWNADFTERMVSACDIHRGDVSVVNQGANPATSASVRSREAAQMLAATGPDGIVEALIAWRNWTLLTLEEREGKTISGATAETLNNILAASHKIDDLSDIIQASLAQLLGVANPDTDDGGSKSSSSGPSDPPPSSTATDGRAYDLKRRRQQALAMGGRR